MHRFTLCLTALAIFFTFAFPHTVKSLDFPGPAPGKATATLEDQKLTLQNAVLSVTWDLSGNQLKLQSITDVISNQTFPQKEIERFPIVTIDGEMDFLLSPPKYHFTAKPTLQRLEPQPGAHPISRRFSGWKATARLASDDGKFTILWTATLRDESNYLQQQLTVLANKKSVNVLRINLLQLDVPGARGIGTVKGSPIATKTMFFACEHPMAENFVANYVTHDLVVCAMPAYRLLEPGQTRTASAVIGVVPRGQLRRGFLYYVERERPRPYQPFFHYNGWLDIIHYGMKVNEKQCIERVHLVGNELTKKRGVKLDAFVFDECWDDHESLWQFNDGFPDGFANFKIAAAQYGGAPGIWISPWGGYGRAQRNRVKYGKAEGFETNSRGLSLAGPKYYARFHDICFEMVQKHGVNHFKFDGVGDGIHAKGANAEQATAVEAMLRLLDELRELKPDLFQNVTVGTWPSPYWLWYSDSIWRGDEDYAFCGPGTSRQQSITYSDVIAYQRNVLRGPLFPLNSLKYHAIFHAKLGWAPKISREEQGLIDDIHFSFGSGKQLLEFFVSAELMTPKTWDALAETARWCRENQDILVDTHWIGGDPEKIEVYGFASWSPRKGILVLRNPSDKPASIEIDLHEAFELPEKAAKSYTLKRVWEKTGDAGQTLQAGIPHTFTLKPFEVMVLEATPIP